MEKWDLYNEKRELRSSRLCIKRLESDPPIQNIHFV